MTDDLHSDEKTTFSSEITDDGCKINSTVSFYPTEQKLFSFGIYPIEVTYPKHMGISEDKLRIELYISENELLDLFDMEKSFFYSLIDNGVINPFYIGSDTFLSIQEFERLLAWIESQRPAP